jgi:alpha-glucosidase
MVWDGAEFGGFSVVEPWLPVKPPQLARHVEGQAGVAGSVLESYREMIAFRKGSEALSAGRTRFLEAGEPVLAFIREVRGGGLLCVFNLSPVAVAVTVEGVGGLVGPCLASVLQDGRLMLGPNAAAFLTVTSEVRLRD